MPQANFSLQPIAKSNSSDFFARAFSSEKEAEEKKEEATSEEEHSQEAAPREEAATEEIPEGETAADTVARLQAQVLTLTNALTDAKKEVGFLLLLSFPHPLIRVVVV